jgi:hypothetical protein
MCHFRRCFRDTYEQGVIGVQGLYAVVMASLMSGLCDEKSRVYSATLQYCRCDDVAADGSATRIAVKGQGVLCVLNCVIVGAQARA